MIEAVRKSISGLTVHLAPDIRAYFVWLTSPATPTAAAASAPPVLGLLLLPQRLEALVAYSLGEDPALRNVHSL